MALGRNEVQYAPILSDPSAPLSPRYDGGYGRDGPPSERLVTPLTHTYQPAPSLSGPSAAATTPLVSPHSPILSSMSQNRGLYVDTSRPFPQQQQQQQQQQSLYSSHGAWSPGLSPPPYYSDAGHGIPTTVGGGAAVVAPFPPKAAFVDVPKSPRSPATMPLFPLQDAHSHHHHHHQQQADTVEEKSAHRLGHARLGATAAAAAAASTPSDPSAWLTKQRGKRRGFRIFVWALILLLLAGMAGITVWRHLTSTSSPSSSSSSSSYDQPGILSWANGPVHATPAANLPPDSTDTAASSLPTSTSSRMKMKRHHHQQQHQRRHH